MTEWTEAEREQMRIDEARQALADRMDLWLEEHAEEDVQKGARRLCWEDRAYWEYERDVVILFRAEDDLALAKVFEFDDDFSTYDEFWAEVQR